MKTAAIIKRDLNGFHVRQNSKTELFNANDLLDLYNLTAKRKKRLDNYIRAKSTKEFQEALIDELNSNTSDSRDLKSGSDIIKTCRGSVNGGTWMHPYLFIHFAMWLSPEFNVQCIKWIYDNLILHRNGAGDAYKEVTAALKERYGYSRDPLLYQKEARLLNKLVFGNTESGQRDKATEEQLKQLERIQKADVKLIKQGFDYYERIEKLKQFKQLLT